MSKHDIDRANARRSQKKAATSAAIEGGTYAVNKYLGNHQVTLNGNSVRFSTQNVSNLMNTAKKVKNFMGYVY